MGPVSRWRRKNGYRDVLAVSLPLALSMASSTVMQFTDRIFLSNYSLNAIAAALPAAIASFLFLSFFMGVGMYTNVFVAQYTGSSRFDQVGASLWQGLYFAFISAAVLACLYFIAEPLFGMGGHPAEVRRLEVTYFRILTIGAGIHLTGLVLSCFYSGRGLTRTIMLVNMTGAAVNIPLDYALINGVWGLPEMGIAGAGLATVAAWTLVTALFALLIFNKENNRRFAVLDKRAFDIRLFGRLMKYGLPGGVEFFIDIFAITFFVFMIGRLGKTELAATNIVFSLNTLAFLPMIGFHIGISTLVGQAVGKKRPEMGTAAATSTVHLTLAYMGMIALSFVLAPEFLLEFFKPRGFTAAEYAPIVETGKVLLRFVAVYSLFDAVALTYFGAVKGAGDAYFPMWAMGLLSVTCMIIPIYLAMEVFGAGLFAAWTFITLYIFMLGLTAWRRFDRGKWKKMSVIEPVPQSSSETECPVRE